MIKLCRSVLGLQFQVETPRFIPMDAPEGPVCMPFLRKAVLNHMNGEPAVLAGQDANTHDRLASRPQAKIR